MKKLGSLFLCLLQFSCLGQGFHKIKGVSFVASREEVSQEQVQEILNIHSNYAAIMPFGFIREVNSPDIIFDTERQWFGETKKGAKQYIQMLHKNGVQVMLKPQIWIWRGTFTGTLTMDSEAEWQALESSYDRFILNYAQLAQETQVDLFCVGTELEQFVKNRPDYWKKLIAKIRAIYKGKLTYAANWDEFTRTTFWEDLDFIGIDAYFPLCEDKTPTVAQCREGWQPHKEKILQLSLSKNKPVLFTEFGYRSADQTAWKPWLADHHENPANFKAQENATKAILLEFWNEEWFAGGFVWKWFVDHEQSGGDADNQFTPQNKPAQQVISDFYKSM
jgi:hypothetical protein